jgi:starch synthase
VRVLFATAELAPFVKVGGLGDAAAGLVQELRAAGVDIEVVLPDYGDLPIEVESETSVEAPEWAGPVTAASGSLDGFDDVTLVRNSSFLRPHPYVDEEGSGWDDNDHRFLVFSAAVASLAEMRSPDLLHLNDWHTAAALGLMDVPPSSVLSIHNLAYQGTASGRWLQQIRRRPEAYEWYGGFNPLTGGIALADRVVTVSPNFAREVLEPDTGFGVHAALAARGDAFVGILNGIDTDVWDPATDPHLPITYDTGSATRKRQIGRDLAVEMGWEPDTGPLVGMVTRLTDQKGVDIALEVARALPDIGARMILLGSGDRALAQAAEQVAAGLPEWFAFRSGYDEGLSHRIFGGSDLYLMPSRFEPAGLTQMQAMRYGTIPIVTDVGGLHDTVIDADADPDEGTGFTATEVTADSVADALARGVRAWRSTKRRGALRRRGMAHDWSWASPAFEYLRLYEEVIETR